MHLWLDPFGKIKLVAEVKRSILLQILNHIYVRLIQWSDCVGSGCVVEWNEEKAFDTEHVTLQNFTQDSRLLNQNKVGSGREVDHAENSKEFLREADCALCNLSWVFDSVFHHITLSRFGGSTKALAVCLNLQPHDAALAPDGEVSTRQLIERVRWT